jgi:hypothetical protein
MKRLWISVSVLLALLGSTLANSYCLNNIINDYTQKLSEAHRLAEADNWDAASELTKQVTKRWHKHDFYFHVMLPHRDIDEIHLTFQEVEEYLKLEESDQYNAANAKLIAQLGLLAEMEQLNLKNIL